MWNIIGFQKWQGYPTTENPACYPTISFPVCLETLRVPGILQASLTFAKKKKKKKNCYSSMSVQAWHSEIKYKAQLQLTNTKFFNSTHIHFYPKDMRTHTNLNIIPTTSAIKTKISVRSTYIRANLPSHSKSQTPTVRSQPSKYWDNWWILFPSHLKVSLQNNTSWWAHFFQR